jgi:hypothetical protein
MKKYFSISILLFLASSSFGQNAGKVGGISDNAINKIGSVPLNSIGKIGNITADVIYKNCKEILLNNPEAPDGVYTIDPDGSGSNVPYICFCDMTTDGGGWTMVGYYKNPSNYQDFILSRSDAFYGTEIANQNSTTAWTDWRVLSGVIWPVQFAVILDQPTYSTWGSVNAKVIYRVKSRDIMPNYGTNEDLTTGDNLYYKVSFADAYNDVGSSSSSSIIHWYPFNNSNGNQLILFHTDGGYTTYYGSGIPGGDNTWYHSARMFIR